MSKWFGEFSYHEEFEGEVEGIEADTKEEAESLVHEYVRNTFPEAMNIALIDVKEMPA